MKFGLRYANTGRYVRSGPAVELSQAGEAAGFESIWTVEHVVVPSGYESAYPYSPDGKMAGGAEDLDLPDPLIWMAWVASATTTIKVATGILVLPQRNPVVTAKAVATLDAMSGGRVLLGVGVGWLREEFDTLGADFDERAAITDEYIAALRALWTEGPSSFAGRFVSFDRVWCRPRPAQAHVPIIVGGHSKAAARRAGRIGDGFFPARGAPAELLEEVRRAAEEAGRDPDAVEITTSLPDDLDDIGDLARRGVSRLLVPTSGMAGLQPRVGSLEDVAAFGEVIERYADL
jgi:probable F420-dependent oxidoreductase